VELLTGLFTGVGRRYARIDEVLRGADHSGEPGLRELWQTSEEQRLTGARIWATSLLGKGRFRDGVDLDTATDLVWRTWHRTSTTGSSTSAAGPTIASSAG
jgi:hypothetical protein